MRANFSIDDARRGEFLLKALNPEVQHWYRSLCAFVSEPLQQAIANRAERMTRELRGPRVKDMKDAVYIGGVPRGWIFSGCNPSRFKNYPVWPPTQKVQEVLAAETLHDVYSSAFVYPLHAPAPKEIKRLVKIVSSLLANTTVPLRKQKTGARQAMHHERSRAAESLILSHLKDLSQSDVRLLLRQPYGSSLEHTRETLAVALRAKLSVLRMAKSIEKDTPKMLPAFNQRDNTYSWQWA